MASSKEYQMLFQLSAKLGGEFSSTFSTGQKAVSQLQNQINALNKTQADISAYQKQQTALDRSKEKLELYQRQLERLKGVEASTAAEEARLANEIDAKQQQVDKAQDAVDKNNAKLSEMGNALREAGVDTNNLADETARLKTEADAAADAQKKEAEAAEESGQSMRDAIEGAKAALETAGLIKGLEMVYNSLMECSNAAAQFETAMAGVKRTVGGNDEFISGLGETFKELSTEMPITATELANIATTAGQLGIAQGNVESFTQVMAQLATTTDLSADNAATMLAQFSNITGITDYDRLGSTVASLGDATATTASKVVEMSQGMAAAANIAGMSSTDILAISAAVGSLGIEAASGSTSMSTLISTLYKATETGNNLEEYARVAGMSAQQFKQAWGEDAVGAMNAFIQGLNDTERNGKSAIVILDELGINNVRQTKAILGLASAGDLLSNTIAQANTAWNQNTALTEKASVMYNTTEAKMTMMQNAANNVQVAIGDALNPAIGAAYDALTGLLQPISEFIEANPALVQGITAFVGTIGIAAVAITGITAVTKLWAAANSLLSLSIPGVGILLGVAAAIGIGVGAISGAKDAAEEAKVSFSELTEEYEKLQDEFEDNQRTIELVANYKQLNEEAENLKQLMSGHYTVDISATVLDSDKIQPDQFLTGTKVMLTAGQMKTLTEAGFMRDDDPGITISAGQVASLVSSGFLKKDDPGITVTAEQVATLLEEGFLRPDDPGITLKAGQVDDLKAIGFLAKDDPGIELTAQQKKTLKAVDFMDPDAPAIELTAKQVKNLMESGFMNPDDPGLTLTAEQSHTLFQKGFLSNDDPGITLTAQQTATLLSTGFLQPGDNGVVRLTGQAIRDIQASQFMADKIVTITGEAGNTLTAANFGLTDQTLLFIAEIDPESYADVESKAKALAKEFQDAGRDLKDAQTKLSEMQTNYAELTEQLSKEKNNGKKNEITTRMGELSDAIDAQKENVRQLQVRYSNLEGEYTIAAHAAVELRDRENELALAKEALIVASGGLITVSGDEAAAFDEMAKAAKDANDELQKAYVAKVRLAFLNTINDSIRDYAESAKIYEESSATVKKATEEMGNMGSTADFKTQLQEIVDTVGQLQNATDEHGNLLYDWDSEEIQEYRKQFELLVAAATGYDIDAYSFAAMGQAISLLGNDEEMATKATAGLGDAIESASADAKDAESKMRSFIDNTVLAIESGAIDAAQAEQEMRKALQGTEYDASIVDKIMEKVNATIEEHAEAAKEAAEATEELANATEELNSENTDQLRSMDEIIQDIDTLVKSYDDAYKAAKESMEGQFKLFGEAKQVTGKADGTKGYTKNLAEQDKYIKAYQENYEKAAQALQAAEDKLVAEGKAGAAGSKQSILAQLADGSAESAQILADLAKASSGDIEALVSQYSTLQTTKDSYAKTVAEIETNFDETMSELQTELDNTVANMDFSEEAAQNAKTSMEAFEAAIKDEIGPAAQAAADLAAAVNKNLKIKFSGLNLPFFASGTDNAPPGFAIVGENGPELVALQGGEQILSAAETRALAASAAIEPTMAVANSSGEGGGKVIHVDFNPQYVINGSANAEEIRSVLEEQTLNMKEQIREVLEEIQEDDDRRDYA